MAGDILVIDGVATNRIVLKVKLLAAQYRVRLCANLAEAEHEIANSLPDLIMIDTALDDAAFCGFCAQLKKDARTSLTPVIATGCFPTPRDRVAALEAGADDVLTKPFDDQVLQARIRSLLRARDARAELRMREGTRTALGFSEVGAQFVEAASVVIATPTGDLAADLMPVGTDIDNCQITTTAIEDLSSPMRPQGPVDVYVVDFRSGLDDEAALFRLLAEMRSQSRSRHSGLLVLLPPSARQAAAMALDLGANDIVCSPVDGIEIRHRCAVLVRAKQEADALRRTVETGLEAAITDPLTGLFNRRYALPHLSRLSAESHKAHREFAIMVLDLDHFKTINDTHGHKAGDEILCQVASRLKGNLRAVDLLARIGGEEFLVAIPNSDVIHARTAAERLCRLIADTPFYVGDGHDEIGVTMSVGVSLSGGQKMQDVVDDLESLVNAADTALYDAKNTGRNKVSLAAA